MKTKQAAGGRGETGDVFVKGGGLETRLFLWWICPGVKFTRLACVEIREAYLSKESSETMQIEGGGHYVSIWYWGEGGRRRGEKEKGEK